MLDFVYWDHSSWGTIVHGFVSDSFVVWVVTSAVIAAVSLAHVRCRREKARSTTRNPCAGYLLTISEDALLTVLAHTEAWELIQLANVSRAMHAFIDGDHVDGIWLLLASNRFAQLWTSGSFPELRLGMSAEPDRPHCTQRNEVDPEAEWRDFAVPGRTAYFTLRLGWHEAICRLALLSQEPRLLTILQSELLDLTDFLHQHPGSPDILHEVVGCEAQEYFEMAHEHSPYALSVIPILRYTIPATWGFNCDEPQGRSSFARGLDALRMQSAAPHACRERTGCPRRERMAFQSHATCVSRRCDQTEGLIQIRQQGCRDEHPFSVPGDLVCPHCKYLRLENDEQDALCRESYVYQLFMLMMRRYHAQQRQLISERNKATSVGSSIHSSSA